MANLAALRAAVFSLSAKNRTGGGLKSTPPPVQGLIFRRMAPRGSQIKMNRVQNKLANTMVHVIRLGTVWHIVDFLHLFVTVS